jgi:hypothetical protein
MRCLTGAFLSLGLASKLLTFLVRQCVGDIGDGASRRMLEVLRAGGRLPGLSRSLRSSSPAPAIHHCGQLEVFRQRVGGLRKPVRHRHRLCDIAPLEGLVEIAQALFGSFA